MFDRLILSMVSLCLIGCGVLALPSFADDDWKTVKPDNGGFAVSMPSEPKKAVQVLRPFPDKEIKVHMFSVTHSNGKAVFLVGYHDLDFDTTEADKIKDVLDGGVKGSVLNGLGKLTTHRSITLDDRFPGRHFEYDGNRFNQKLKVTSRLYLVGQRIYQVTVLQDPTIDIVAETAKFQDSFDLVEIVTANPDPNDAQLERDADLESADPADSDKTSQESSNSR